MPEITLDKNLFNNDKFGNLDLQTNIKIHNYDTNKLTSFVVNDFDWESREKFFNSGFNTKLLANIKNINYEAKNVEPYKESETSEIYGALGLLAELKLHLKNMVFKPFIYSKIAFERRSWKYETRNIWTKIRSDKRI